MKLEVGNVVKYNNSIEKIMKIEFKVNANMIDYRCVEVTIEFASGEFYYNEIQSFEDDVNEIRKTLIEMVESDIEKASD